MTLPAGVSVLRFEGVAEGLLPETAVVSGLPDGVIEKNRDARLLSPAGLVDAYLKRSVTLRRTNRFVGGLALLMECALRCCQSSQKRTVPAPTNHKQHCDEGDETCDDYCCQNHI